MPAPQLNLPPLPRAPARASQLRLQRQAEAVQREQLLARLRLEHPDWASEQILFAALAELNQGASQEFLRHAAGHIADWSQGQGVKLSRRSQ